MTVAEIASELPLSSWTEDIRRKNPLDHLGRSASVLACMARDGVDAGESLCTQCGKSLHVCDGDMVAPYLAHACSESESRCPGSYETLWHLAAKRAAARMDGWKSEVAYIASGCKYKADAMHLDSGRVFEAVHSLSRDYVEKHRNTMRSGRDVTWLFDASASFARPLTDLAACGYPSWAMKFDIDYANAGQLVAAGIFRKRARLLIQEIGRESCFIYFCGHCFRCIKCDEDGDLWELAKDSCTAAKVVYGFGGLNFEVVHSRAAGHWIDAVGDLDTGDFDAHPDRVLKKVVELGLLLSIRRSHDDGEPSRRGVNGGRHNASKILPPEEWPGVLVNLTEPCSCGSFHGVDVQIHCGRSTRRDCARCMKFLLFSRWYNTDNVATK